MINKITKPDICWQIVALTEYTGRTTATIVIIIISPSPFSIFGQTNKILSEIKELSINSMIESQILRHPMCK
jgi:hypothetical protein